MDRLAGASTVIWTLYSARATPSFCWSALTQLATLFPLPQHCVSTQLIHALATVHCQFTAHPAAYHSHPSQPCPALLAVDCRLQDMVLRWLPVTHNKAVDAEAATTALGDSPIKSVLRSKGFMWLSNKHATAFYWSHAGGWGQQHVGPRKTRTACCLSQT